MKLRSIVLTTVVCLILTELTGCNTVAGIGQDIQSGGRAIERAGQ
jgi:predicted small secreted protein